MKKLSPAIVASIDSPWTSLKDLEYSINFIKTSLIFFKEIFINDSEIIDSNQFRYSFDEFFQLVEKDLVKIIQRKESITEILNDMISRNPPMLFSAFDYRFNENLIKLRKNNELNIEKFYKELDNYDLRHNMINVKKYSEYIQKIESLKGHSIVSRLPDDLFKTKISEFSKKIDFTEISKFNTRTEIYYFIESIETLPRIQGLDPVEISLIKKGLKSLVDIIYILNKVYLLNTNETIFVIFDEKHLKDIEEGTSYFKITLEDILASYKDKKIKILRIYPIKFDKDINFFIEKVVPLEILTILNTDLTKDFLNILEDTLEKNDQYEEKHAYIKYFKKKEKYSKTLERRFPRLRSILESSFLILIILELIFNIILHSSFGLYQIILLAMEIAVSIDGLLGFIEYGSSKRINTAFYENIQKWYKEQNKKLEDMSSQK